MTSFIRSFAFGGGVDGSIAIVKTFQRASGATGLQTITDTRLGGQTPKGMRIFLSVASLGAARFSVGAATASAQWGIAGVDADASASEVTYRAGNTTWVGGMPNTAGTGLTTKVNRDSFVTDGVVLNWTAIAATVNVTLVLFGGNDISCAAGVITNPTTAGGTVSIGFEPKAIMLASIWASTTDNNSVSFTGSEGWATNHGGSIQQQSCAWHRINGLNTEGMSWTNGDALHSCTDAGAVSEQFDITAFGGTSFDWDIDADFTAAVFYFAVGGSGIVARTGHHSAATSGASQARTGVGFQGNVLLQMTPVVTVGAPTSSTNMRWGIHAADDDGNIGGITFSSVSAGTSDTGGIASTTSIKQLTVSDATYDEATVPSFDSDGFTKNYSTLPAATVVEPYLVFQT